MGPTGEHLDRDGFGVGRTNDVEVLAPHDVVDAFQCRVERRIDSRRRDLTNGGLQRREATTIPPTINAKASP